MKLLVWILVGFSVMACADFRQRLGRAVYDAGDGMEKSTQAYYQNQTRCLSYISGQYIYTSCR